MTTLTEILLMRSLLNNSKPLNKEISIFFGDYKHYLLNPTLYSAKGSGYHQVRRLILSGLVPFTKEELEKYLNNPTEEELFSPQPDQTLCSVHPSSRELILEYWWYIKELKIDDMSIEEFNLKYKKYLKKGFKGLEINNQDVINYLDDKFKVFIKNPEFEYSQIKVKFGKVGFYCKGVSPEETFIVESYINNLLNITNLLNDENK
jgi:hypothetical protein